jgi:hypothetical protein
MILLAFIIGNTVSSSRYLQFYATLHTQGMCPEEIRIIIQNQPLYPIHVLSSGRVTNNRDVSRYEIVYRYQTALSDQGHLNCSSRPI